MSTIVKVISVVALSMAVATAQCQDDKGTPAEQFAAILAEYGPASGGMRTATTDLERKECVERLGKFSLRFLELAEKFPNDPVALDALRQAVPADLSTDSAALNAWEMNSGDYPAGSPDGSAARIVERILLDYVLREDLGPLIDRLRYGYRMEYARCLDTVLAKNPHREMQGLACLALAQFLNDRLQMIQLAGDRPELATCYATVFGEDYLPALERLGRVELAARIESLFERAISEFGDVKLRDSTLGEVAKSELYAIHNLSIGVVAPDIEGQDQDGTPFKLGDYRGKVVLLYFWSEY